MDLMNCIRIDYQEKVAMMNVDSELKRALRTHERIPVLFTNLARELHKIQGLTREQIKMIVYDYTEIYMRNVERMANERVMSEVKKSTIEAEHKEKENLKALAEKVYETGVWDGEEEG